MKTIYLCGGINGLSDSECKDWRERVKSVLGDKYRILDPMRRDYRGKEESHMHEIVTLDKEDIDASDIVIANATRPSWGTAMEILYAFERGKSVASVVESKTISPWLKFHSSAGLFDSLDTVIRDLKGMA